MSDPVKPRRYRSSLREEQARRTRQAILSAARQVFAERGYAATTIAQIAATAGVAVDTVYASVGTKPVLMRLLIETAISGIDQAVPAGARTTCSRSRAPSPQDKIRIYAAAVMTDINRRMAPLFTWCCAAQRDCAGAGEMRDEIPPGGQQHAALR
jgi:AcrR family transcriptional regulator